MERTAPSSDGGAGGPGAPRGFRAGLIWTFALWAAVFFWLGGRADSPWRGHDYSGTNDYYNILVDGFLSGHLSMNAAVHPDLLSPDPLLRSRAPYMLDAALYHGRYYLYYGVTPAVVLLYPFALLTGRHLSLQWACFIFVIAGLGACVCWLGPLRRRLGDRWGPGFAFCAVSILAVVPGTLFLARRSSFYDLPIAAGYAWTSVMWISLWQALAGRRPQRWLLLASASFGLAVGCRANLILLGPMVLACPWFLGGEARRRASAWLSVTGPAAAIGAGLAWYNTARFGNPLDFGFEHGLNSFFQTGNPLFSPRFFLANARAYLLLPPAVSPLFPFDFPIDPGTIPRGFSNSEWMNGFLPVTLLAAWIAAAALAAGRRRPSGAAPWAWLLLAASLVQAGFMFFLGIRAYRYAVDFLGPLSLVLVLGLAGFWAAGGWRGLLARSGAAVLGTGAALHMLLGSVQLFSDFRSQRPAEFAALSSLLNPHHSTLEVLGAPRPGGATLRVRFLKPSAVATARLVVTGTPDASDSLQATVFPNGYVEFSIIHGGYGGPRTQLIPIAWGRPYVVQVFMGSLFPAESDPYFGGVPREAAKAMKTLGWLGLDGKALLQRRMAFYEGSAWPKISGVSESGERVAAIDSAELGIPAPSRLTDPQRSPAALYSLELALPDPRSTRPFPLLCSGVTGNGDLLYFDPLPDGRYRLGVDEWGIGAVFGEPFVPKIAKLVHVDIVAGPALRLDPRLVPLEAAGRMGALEDRLMVWYAGELVGNLAIAHHLDTFDTLQVGVNEAGFSSAVDMFVGELHRSEMAPTDEEALLERAERVPRGDPR